MHKAQIVRWAGLVLQPSEQTLYLPAAAAAEHPAVLDCELGSPAPVGRDHLDALGSELSVERVAVVGFVADQALWSPSNKTLLQSCLDKGDFSRASTRRVDGDRKTKSVCHCHELRAFAPLGRAYGKPLFAWDCPQFSVEMETGKTYVYLRTIYELNRKHGFKKFVVVVPRVAIREGVRVNRLRQFAVSNAVQIMVINIDAFNKDTTVIKNSNDRRRGARRWSSYRWYGRW